MPIIFVDGQAKLGANYGPEKQAFKQTNPSPFGFLGKSTSIWLFSTDSVPAQQVLLLLLASFDVDRCPHEVGSNLTPAPSWEFNGDAPNPHLVGAQHWGSETKRVTKKTLCQLPSWWFGARFGGWVTCLEEKGFKLQTTNSRRA